MLPVEFGSFHEGICLSITDETMATETLEALRVVSVFTSKLSIAHNTSNTDFHLSANQLD